MLPEHYGFGKLQSKATRSPNPILEPCISTAEAWQDDTEAVMWFRKAAEQRDSVELDDWMALLGMYAEGRGVPQHYIRAYMWFILSAAQGEQRAVKTLEMAKRRITQAQKLARDWKPATQPTLH